MDTVANMLTSILNAQRVGKERVVVPYSRFSKALAELLRDKGYVAKVTVRDKVPAELVIVLQYDGTDGRIHHMRRLSVPGQRRYVSKHDIPYAVDGLGMVVLSTSRGVIDDGRARRDGLGGELVCEVW